MSQAQHEIVLASGSATRHAMLEAAGVAHRCLRPEIDERAVKAEALAADPALTPAALALQLARAKAEAVSGLMPAAFVIGSDQVLSAGGGLLSKPADRDEARRQLMALRGQTHTLYSAAVLARGGAMVWASAEAAKLTMRAFSDVFLDDYLDRAGELILGSVGAYQIEGLGITLMERIEGDHFTVLGMPLLALLGALRDQGAIAS